MTVSAVPFETNFLGELALLFVIWEEGFADNLSDILIKATVAFHWMHGQVYLELYRQIARACFLSRTLAWQECTLTQNTQKKACLTVIIGLGCASSGSSVGTSHVFNNDASASQFAVAVFVLAFFFSIGSLASDYLYGSVSNVKRRRHILLSDVGGCVV
ncbi:unnamed protein product [Dibothriocephalus latus]|uniref:Uncharacterized protein n=1 Tax=Dibothriocephalus latus TaxID=60516 RepID=A0A3P6TNY2_DIBLA|nr:unnamed protein product [Dibothriocephalus latus]